MLHSIRSACLCPAHGGSYVSFASDEKSGGVPRLTTVFETSDGQYCNRSLDTGGPGGGSRGCVNAKALARAPQDVVRVLCASVTPRGRLVVWRR